MSEAPEAAPPEFSVNDVNNLRHQDQFIAQLAAQMNELSVCPFACSTDVIKAPSRISCYSTILSAFMTPIANKGSNRGIGGGGTLHTVQVGNSKITAEGDSEAVKLVIKLNCRYFEIIHKYRLEILRRIANDCEDLKKGKAFVVDKEGISVFKISCGQTALYVMEEEQALKFMDKLTEMWDLTVKTELARLAGEMERIATDKDLILTKNR